MKMKFEEFMNMCENWHIQSYVYVLTDTNNHSLYEGEFCDMPRIIAKCFYITKFYIMSVDDRSIVFKVHRY